MLLLQVDCKSNITKKKACKNRLPLFLQNLQKTQYINTEEGEKSREEEEKRVKRVAEDCRREKRVAEDC